MNAWTTLLENASRQFRCSDSGATPMLVFKNSYFYAKFEQPQAAQQNNGEACQWLKTLDIDYLFRMGYLCFNVHAPGHWFLAVICFRQHEICFLDSIPKDHKKWFDRLMDFLTYLAKTKCSTDERFDRNEWRKIEVDVPCQKNAYDCGVFSCMFMLHFVAAIFQDRQPSFPFNQSNIIEIRYAMSFAFLQKSISEILEEWFIRFYTNQ
jgi:Ulp1 family protease